MSKCPECGFIKEPGRKGVFVCPCGYYYKPNPSKDKEFDLSKKLKHDIEIVCLLARDPTDQDATKFVNATEKIEEDVKEFIKRLKEHWCGCPRDDGLICSSCEVIDELAGERLR